MNRRFGRADLALVAVFGGTATALLLAPDAAPRIVPESGLVALLVVFATAALASRRPALHAAAALLLALAAEHLLFFPGQPRGHDLMAHGWGLWGFFKAMHDGDPTPAWLHHLSLGLPLPLYYSPAGYYVLTPFYWLGLQARQVLEAAFLLHAVVGTLGAWWVGRRFTGSSRAGLVAAAAWAFAPYRLLVGHYRVALGESAALALFPYLFGLYFDSAPWTRRRTAAAAAVAALVILVHPLSVLTAGVAALVWQGMEGRTASKRRLVRRSGAALLGLLLAGFYVVPMVHRLGDVAVSSAVHHRDVDHSRDSGEIRLADQGLRLTQPFRRLPWWRVLHPEPKGSPRDADGREMPAYLGWGLALSLLAAALLGWRSGKARLGLTVAVVGLFSLALTLEPLAALLARLPLLPTLQFAWRFLGPATVAGALAAAFVARAFLERRRAAWAALFLVLLAADGLPYTGAADWAPPHEGFTHFFIDDPRCEERWGCWATEEVPGTPSGTLPMRVYGTFLPPADWAVDVAHVKPGFGEYLNERALWRVLAATEEDRLQDYGARWIGTPRRGGVEERDAVPWARFLGPAAVTERELAFTRRAGTIEVELAGKAGEVVLLEQYNPGWTATVDGREVAVEATAGGLMRVVVGEGDELLRMRFRVAGWDAWTGRGLSVAAFLLVFFLAARKRPIARKTPQTPQNATTSRPTYPDS